MQQTASVGREATASDTDVALLFPPSWTYCAGGPHLALPLLQARLKEGGFRTVVYDLNWEYGRLHTDGISAAVARAACQNGSMEHLNAPYFQSEDRLDAVARKFGGRWNAQAGFEYDDIGTSSSASTLEAVRRPSPFAAWYSEVIVPRIAAMSPRVVGITVASVQQLLPSFQLCCLLREAGYDGLIVMGGNTVSRLWAELRSPALFEFCDGFVRFQGEEALLAFCRAATGQSEFENVPSLLWASNGKVVENTGIVAPIIEKMPTPDFSGLPVGRYWGENYLTLVAARGCYYGRCTFCAIPYGWGFGGFAGDRSPERVVGDVKELVNRHGIRRFKFVDEALSPRFLRRFAELIRAERLDIEWEGYVRLETAWYERSFVELLAHSGFRKGYFGLELLPSAGRNLMNKHDNPDPETLLSLCAGAGILVHFFCMVGFPGTGGREAEDTVRFLVQNDGRIDTADLFPWTLAKHTTVAGVERVTAPDNDWALEFAHEGSASILSSADVQRLAEASEEIIWDEAPRLLHPTYRLVSPWIETSASALSSSRQGEASVFEPSVSEPF